MSEPRQAWDQAAYLRIRRGRDAVLEPIASFAARVGIAPSAVSLIGVALAASVCWVHGIAPRLALAAFVGALLCDALDGAIARRVGSSSALGKRIDHACDAATFLLVLAAIARCGLAPTSSALLPAGLVVPLLLLAIHCRRRRGRARSPEAFGGFFAHLFKVPVYGAFLLYLAGGVDLVAPAVQTSTVIALVSAGVMVAGLTMTPVIEPASTQPHRATR